ncbi:hypothetical protein [Xanthomonas translucens]|uniref:Uncharacterized protein n=2 Tax=Xanthomonas campestris pv. translucens TaxID=343 RepID=A0ABW9KT60_XANCT|nr:hypothetical protein [Xanthomonas translucens]MBC3970748.1 hypothetical protein [Xanthomonas translucens pv. undulosa]MCT8270798.1 hypothetical protein [Xanthomonas translucens pv. undulosa]MCT8282229.1 hypothetical protein [Xanthomonas translucens pv. undulosa]MCT8317844.1 hypothetical protein [Xanthomonas translucens pv. undulosa]QSQ34961.1 hypothetical protein ISN31_05035 [Xanthomonas translucens pv. translucens]
MNLVSLPHQLQLDPVSGGFVSGTSHSPSMRTAQHSVVYLGIGLAPIDQ